MKKITFLLLMILPFLTFGQNLLTNPNFVDGTGWSAIQTNAASGWDGTDTQTADGSGFYNLVNNGSFNTRINQTVLSASVTNGDYLISFWVKGTAGTKVSGETRDNNANIEGTWTGDGTSNVYTINTTDTWEYAEFIVPVTGLSNVNVRVYNRANVDGVAVKVDDVNFYRVNVVTEDGWVSNPNFETSSDWSVSGGETSLSYDADVPTGGLTQSGKITFDVNQTTNQFLENPIYDFGKTVNPNYINSTIFVKSNNTGIKFQLAVKTFDADGNGVESFFAGVENVSTADTWASFSLSHNPTLPFNQIQYRIRLNDNQGPGLQNDVILFDNITASFSYIETGGLTEKNTYDFANDNTFGFIATDGLVTDGGSTLDFSASGSVKDPRLTHDFYVVDSANLNFYMIVDENNSNAAFVTFYFKDASGTNKFYGRQPLNVGSPTIIVQNNLSSKPEWTGQITEWSVRFEVENPGATNVTAGTIKISEIGFTNTNRSIADDNWGSNATWLLGSSPTATQDVIINNDVAVGSDRTANNVTVTSNGKLTFNNGDALTLTGDLINEDDNPDSVIMRNNSNTFSSLIVDGTVTGQIRHRRNINGLNGTEQDNDLIASAVTVSSFTSIGTGGLVQDPNSDAVLFGIYNNATPAYEYWLSTDTGKSLTPGTGYVAGASADPGSLFNFEGTVTTTQVDVSITDETGAGGSDWNLIGNPYPSYISFQDFYDLATDEANSNADNKLNPLFGIYGYDTDDSDGSIWTVWDKNNTSYATDLITPGQGFFVKARAGAGTSTDDTQINFLPSMRTTGASDDFIAGRNANSNLATVIIKMNVASTTYNASLFFRDFNTNGIDVGYDTGAYDQNATGVFTQLVEQNTGVNLVNQSLPYTGLSDVLVPLTVNIAQGTQFVISLDQINSILPNTINVYLEDTLENTFTLLNTSAYILTPSSNLSGTGRFFLRVSEDALSLVENPLDTLQVYALNDLLIVNGTLKVNTVLNLYDIQGRLVISQTLDSSKVNQRIDVSNTTTGVYVVVLEANGYSETKKVIIN